MRKVRLIFIDGSELTRTLFRYVLEGSSGIEVVGEAADRESAMTLVRRYAPDAVVIGYELPRCEETELRSHLQVEFPQTKIIDLTDLDQAISSKIGATIISSGTLYSRMVH